MESLTELKQVIQERMMNIEREFPQTYRHRDDYECLQGLKKGLDRLLQNAKTTNQIRYGMRNPRMKGTEKWVAVNGNEK